MRMEKISPIELARKRFFYFGVCLLVCISPGLSSECRGVLCGYGTNSKCFHHMKYLTECECKANFLYTHTRKLFGRQVQFCLENCDGPNTCPTNYRCKKNKKLCICSKGYRRSANGECVESCDILTCVNGTQQCFEAREKAICITCLEGYQINSFGSCINKNECFYTTRCIGQQHTKCVNTPGSFLCDCLQGFKRTDNDLCQDIDECNQNGICDDKNNTDCANIKGSFICKCVSGYASDRTNTSCQDIDECNRDGICENKNNTVCVNTQGSFNCECLTGYTSGRTNTSCKDIDECNQEDICDDKNNTVCVNTKGSFFCECLPGYTSGRTNTSCKDIDKCEMTPSDCVENSICENLPGNYSCQCLGGYALSTDGNSTCIFDEKAASRFSDPNTGGSVGLYVGVTIGVLALLIILVVAIFIRRRRNSKKSCEGTAQFSSRQPEENVKPETNVTLENEEVHVPAETSNERRISVEYSNHKIPLKKFERSPSSVSAEYSNNKIHSKMDRDSDDIVSSKCTQPKHVSITDQSKDETVYSAPYELHVIPQSIENISDSSNLDSRAAVNFEDPSAYNTLDSFNLNTNTKPETRQNKAADGVYSTPFGEPGQPNGNDNMVEISNKTTGDKSDTYNTLDAFSLNTQHKPSTENKIVEDQNPYNTIPE